MKRKGTRFFALQEITVQLGSRHEQWRNKGLPRVWNPELFLTEWLNWLLLTPVRGGRDIFPSKLSSLQRSRKEGRNLSNKKGETQIGVPTNQGPPRK